MKIKASNSGVNPKGTTKEEDRKFEENYKKIFGRTKWKAGVAKPGKAVAL